MSGWAYMVRCFDGSYYVGSTAQDVSVRVWEHNHAAVEAYTSTRRPVTLVWCTQCDDLREAQAMENRVKGWSRKKKEALVRDDWETIRNLAKRPGTRRPSRVPSGPPQDDAVDREAPNKDRRPEVHAKRASKGEGGKS